MKSAYLTDYPCKDVVLAAALGVLYTLFVSLAGCATRPAAPTPESPRGVQKIPTVNPPAESRERNPRASRQQVVVAAVGDIMLGGTAAPELREHGYDYPFMFMRDYLADAQIVFGNLEGPLTHGGEREPDKQYAFRSPPEKVAPALKAAGFNVVSLANNHTLDYGAVGLADTRAALDAVGIASVGAADDEQAARVPAILTVGNVRVAFLAYSATLPENFYATANKPGTAFAHEHHVRADVARARDAADVVLVSFHWGQEGKTELRDYQTRLGRAAIDAGALAVLGHHPHILQGIERYGAGVILYSLGNFTFGSYSKTATRSMIAQLFFVKEGDEAARLQELRLIPINVNNVELVFRPQPLGREDADAVIAQLQTLSQPLNAQLENRDGVAHLDVR